MYACYRTNACRALLVGYAGGCTLSVSTSDASFADTDNANISTQFFINGLWEEPLMFYKGELDKKSTTNVTYFLDYFPSQMRLIMEENSNHWGIWRITLHCFRSCLMVVLEDPNGEDGTPFDEEAVSLYWMGSDGSGVLDHTYPIGE